MLVNKWEVMSDRLALLIKLLLGCLRFVLEVYTKIHYTNFVLKPTAYCLLCPYSASITSHKQFIKYTNVTYKVCNVFFVLIASVSVMTLSKSYTILIHFSAKRQ